MANRIYYRIFGSRYRFWEMVVALVLLFVVINIENTYSQPANRRSSIDSNRVIHNGRWYCGATAQYQQKFPMLENIPPLSTGMPYDILLTYIYGDSLLKHLDFDTAMSTIKRWEKGKIKNDTITGLIKYLYQADDYDPIRLNQYGGENSTDLGYKMGVGLLKYAADNLIDFTSTDHRYLEAYSELIQADYVLRIRITSILDSAYSVRSLPTDSLLLYNLNAEVLDTLKGKVYLSCFNYPPNSLESIAPIPNEICFEYSKGRYTHEGDPYQPDESLLNSDRQLYLRPGQELIIFVEMAGELYDYNNDYFDQHLIVVYPVINGQVKDITHIWSDSTLLNYSDWKNAFNQRKQTLLSGGY